MASENQLFWSAFAMGQFLDLPSSDQQRIDDCVNLIRSFPLIGVRLLVGAGRHHRRFVCYGFRIVYSLEVGNDADKKKQGSIDEPPPMTGELSSHMKITIRRFARS
jgi:hypothetical protein